MEGQGDLVISRQTGHHISVIEDRARSVSSKIISLSLTPIMENDMEQSMDNTIEAGSIWPF